MTQTTGKIRAAKISGSPRLARVNSLLQDGNWHGTREISRGCDVYAVNTIIAELRENGICIETRCVGQGRYEYRLAALVVKAKATDEAA
ncbi:MAG: hypothetical protein ACOY32_15235 [Thermodesulfobacteriota bacterium]